MKRIALFFLCALVFFIPIENVVIFDGFGTVAKLVGIGAAVMAFFSVVIEKKSRNLSSFQYVFALFVFYSLASFYWTIDIESSEEAMISLIQHFIFVAIVWEVARSDSEQNKIMSAYVLGCYFAAASVLLAFAMGFESSFFRYSAYGFDPNDLGLMLVLGVPMAWYLFLGASRIIYKILYVGYVPLAFFSVTLTASRSAFIVLIIANVFIFMTIPKTSMVYRFALWVIIGLSGYFLVQWIPTYSWDRLSTIGSEVSAGSLNARTVIWESGIVAFVKNPIWGTGIGSFKASIEQVIGMPRASHNLFLSILVGQGIAGFLLFCSMLVLAVFAILKMPMLKLQLWSILLLTWGMGVMTLGWELKKPTYLILALIISQAAALPARDRDHERPKEPEQAEPEFLYH